MGLSEDARKELHDAISIVRADRLERHIRSAFKPADPAPTEPPVKAPPKKDPVDPPTDPQPRKGGYWGELLADG